MKIYTKTGDQGETSLFGGGRVSKSNLRVKAYGSLDELNSFIGLLRDYQQNEHYKTLLLQIQNDLFVMGSHLATPLEIRETTSGKPKISLPPIHEAHITDLENAIDQMNDQLPEMTHFILPGGHPVVSFCHIARNVCRRAERNCVELALHHTIEPIIITYLNRLSDYLFVLARMLAKDLSVKEILWNS